MRLWTVHPAYLDTRGLVALWREALLAKAVLAGRTRGYRHHPQLDRFRSAQTPIAAINAYLRAIHDEGTRRGYRFDVSKLGRSRSITPLTTTRGQVEYEWEHLLAKLRSRSPDHFHIVCGVARPRAHPLFRVRPGPVATWERTDNSLRASSAPGR